MPTPESENFRREVILIGVLLVLVGILLYSDIQKTLAVFLRQFLIIAGATLILSAAFAKKQN